jgi:glucosamine--fructose-6-phosphate aminotransferase (isomerizing)
MNGSIMLKEIMQQSKVIDDCYEYNMQNIIKISKAIKDFSPQNIVIVGRGTSGHAGIYARYLFELYFHIPVSIASQSVFTVYDSYTDMSKSLVIGISQSGSGNDTLSVLKKAHNSGALTIAIVNNLDSDIAHSADYTLYCNAGFAEALPATKTFTSTIYLINALIYNLTKNEILNVDKNNIKLAIKEGLNLQNSIKDKALAFKNVDDLIILGRGLTLPFAMETALKIKETSHIHVSSYPIAEFYHGPIAMINKNIPVVILGLEKEFNDDIIKILNRLKDKNIPILLITYDETLIEKCDNYILYKANNKFESFFTATIIIQLLAYELSLAKGYNPDTDENLLNIKTF